jgi:hypothetical protein
MTSFQMVLEFGKYKEAKLRKELNHENKVFKPGE